MGALSHRLTFIKDQNFISTHHGIGSLGDKEGGALFASFLQVFQNKLFSDMSTALVLSSRIKTTNWVLRNHMGYSNALLLASRKVNLRWPEGIS